MTILSMLLLITIGTPPKSIHAYVVTRATTVHDKAMLSGRLVEMKAANLKWIESSSVVQVEIPSDAIDRIKADKDVVLVMNSEEAPAVSVASTPIEQIPLVQPMTMPPPANACAFPSQPQQQGLGLGSMGMGIGTGMGMGMNQGMGAMGFTGMVDSMAGSVMNRLMTRAPSCKVAVKNPSVRVNRSGGDAMVEVKASGACAWSAQSTVDWIQITSGSGVSGSGLVTYMVKPGHGKPRSGAISIVAAGSGSPIKGNASVVVMQQ